MKEALQILKEFFGYDSFRPAQEEVISEILKGENVIAVLPTGAGKSVCYQIPALISDNYSIVISPLIALMKDQVDSLNRKKVVAAFINSTLEWVEIEKILNDISFGKIKLLYIAPERLESKEFSERLKAMRPSSLFIDEAHCISEWGHNFRPSYTKIKDFIQFTDIKKVSAFTATATPEVVNDIIKQLDIKKAKVIVKGFERENISISVYQTSKKKEKLLEIIKTNQHPAIIYVSSRKKAESINEFLNLNKTKSEFYHAGLNNILRRNIQEEFIAGKVPIIIATNAFGMGIDKKDIRTVIHYDIPGSIENYYQEIGRAGRDGKPSSAILLFDEKDLSIHKYFIDSAYPKKELIQQIYNGICDYAQIAIGSIPDKNIPINSDFINLYTKQNISSGLLHSALTYLETAGYIKINSSLTSHDSIKFLIDPNKLKQFLKTTENDELKDLILFLVRNFGSRIFDDRTPIDYHFIESNTGLSTEAQKDLYNFLSDIGFAEFISLDGKETVTLLQPRVQKEYLKLNYKLINELYLFAHEKLEKMRAFVYTNECRFKYILNYFGQNTSDYACGKCDKCSSQNHQLEKINFLSEPIEEVELPFDNYDKNLELFHRLNEVRKTAAKKFMQTPNLICPDSVLAKISQLKPDNKYKLMMIEGFTTRMFNKVGNDFIEAIQSYLKEDKNDSEKSLPQNVQETLQLLKKNFSLKEIASIRKLDEAVISMQIETILSYYPEIEIRSILSEEDLKVIETAMSAGYENLRDLKDKLNGKYSVPLLRIAIAKIKFRSSTNH
ncbi:ATP-dependent DNA helicase RecQ [Ignavibacterium album JCM 16511]|uniref:ATP-dependent DNA helicase RecQ n=1 Tax=Ignavibacterium album (strain DSM 19864 / JCM 16511 / NBRC 101810 / Mat9-16) TaxID=945713 RepID=I0AJ27_IGNAJ|nr:RecQ family ATP-dependent DNA helicase [Ignavibacterium album]AFH48984.1 ATP-dependent DNA helicase RecQ [Ignavibacterium album JCM 16511]